MPLPRRHVVFHENPELLNCSCPCLPRLSSKRGQSTNIVAVFVAGIGCESLGVQEGTRERRTFAHSVALESTRFNGLFADEPALGSFL